MIVLLDSEYYRMTEEIQAGYVYLERSTLSFPTIEAVLESIESVLGKLSPRHKNMGIVVDMRNAPSRNDPAFEVATARLRKEIGASFGRVVLLLATASGQMQAKRLHRAENHDFYVSTDRVEAIRLASRRLQPERR